MTVAILQSLAATTTNTTNSTFATARGLLSRADASLGENACGRASVPDVINLALQTAELTRGVVDIHQLDELRARLPHTKCQRYAALLGQNSRRFFYISVF